MQVSEGTIECFLCHRSRAPTSEDSDNSLEYICDDCQETPQYKEYLNFKRFIDKEEGKNSDWQGKLDRYEKREAFKDTFNVTHRASLQCPYCFFGTLWHNQQDDPDKYVCFGCRVSWEIKCLDPDLLEQLKSVPKSDQNIKRGRW